MTMKDIIVRIAMASLLTTGLATTAWAWGTDPGGSCCGTAAGKYRMPNGNLTNVFPARKAAAAKPKSAPAPKPAKPAAPKPRKKMNFTPKKK